MKERMQRIEDILAAAAAGDLSPRIELTETDELSAVEVGVNVLLEDLASLLERYQQKVDALETSLETIAAKDQAIRELSTPVMEIWEGVLVLPLIGPLDSARAREAMETLLQRIADKQPRAVILDVTGAGVIDTRTADHLLSVVRASRLLGAECVLTGLNPLVAQAMVNLGSRLPGVRTLRSLKDGLRHCIGGDRAVPAATERG